MSSVVFYILLYFYRPPFHVRKTYIAKTEKGQNFQRFLPASKFSTSCSNAYYRLYSITTTLNVPTSQLIPLMLCS